MSKKTASRASPADVENRFAARMWLTDAILRAMDQGLDIRPGLMLLGALESLDHVEVVEGLGTATERVIATRADGPANIALQEGQCLRLIGKTDPILTMPEEVPGTIVSARAGGPRSLSAETSVKAKALAITDRLIELGHKPKYCIRLVEEATIPVENLRKKLHSRRAPPDLVERYDKELHLLRLNDEDGVHLHLKNLSSIITKKVQ